MRCRPLAHTFKTMARIVAGLDYDFTRFEVMAFIAHIAAQRGRDILVKGYPFQREVSGVWIRAETADYIFYNNTLHPIHQTHSILHELAHPVLGHRGQSLAAALPPDFWQPGAETKPVGRLRAPALIGDDEQEREAELFVGVIQKQVLSARRFQELYTGHSSSAVFRPYADGMGFEA